MKKGFTLVELLVVVMIIGVLAAIALPTYRKSVDRTRVAEALVWVKTTSDAVQRAIQERRAMPDGTYTVASGMETLRLDVTPTNLRAFDCAVTSSDAHSAVVTHCTFSRDTNNSFTIMRGVTKAGYAGATVCVGNDDDEVRGTAVSCNNFGFQGEASMDDQDCRPAKALSATICWQRAPKI